MPLRLIALGAIAYLLGSLSGSLLLGRLRGVDIRRQGSGNAGGTNAFRTQGWRFALGVVAIDIGKGAAATWLGQHVAAGAPPPFDTAFARGALCAFAAVVGHCWPVYFGFRGGKGAATAVGAILVLAPALVPPLIATWLLVLLATGYVGLATVAAGAMLTILAYLFSPSAEAAAPLALFAFGVALLIVFTHRGNLSRWVRGEEYRFEKARIAHWLRRWSRKI